MLLMDLTRRQHSNYVLMKLFGANQFRHDLLLYPGLA